MRRNWTITTGPLGLGACAVLALALLISLRPVVAQTPDVGYRGPSYNAPGVDIPTADKPQSKLWFQDGSWWGLLYNPDAGATTIHRLDLSTQTWSDTGAVVDTRPTARGDALWDGQKLYVVSGTTVVSEWSSPPPPDAVNSGSAQLLRFSYAAGSYTLDPGFPVTVHAGSSESITVAKDSTGMLWVTFTKDNQVWVNHSLDGDSVWAAPYVLPTTGAAVHHDDISAVVAFQGDKVGVMWSNQNTKKFYFAVHRDGAPDGSWQSELAYGGGVAGCSGGCANDHLNVRQLSSDGSGRIFAAVKTAMQQTGQPFVALLVRGADGKWNSHDFGTVEQEHTRPMVVIDDENRQVYMFAVSPEVGGAIYYKQSSIDNIVFPPGQGTPFLKSAEDLDISNPTSTKQTVNSTSGLVVLASANTNGHYWHNYLSLADAPPETTITSGPPDPTNSPSATFEFISSTTGATFECSLDSGAWEACSSPTEYSVGVGTHRFEVRARDAAGSVEPTPASHTWTVNPPGTALTLLPSADTYVSDGAVGTNYGSSSELWADGAGPQRSALMRFDVSGAAASPVSATLRIWARNGSVNGPEVYVAGEPWAEYSVTWNTRPAGTGALVADAGAVAAGAWYEFDVSSVVSGDGEYSFLLAQLSSDGTQFDSREGPNPPQLILRFAQ